MKRFLKHKYHAIPQKIDNIRFSSKKEAEYYGKLKILQQNGDILFFLRQVGFDLPGKVRHFIDFQVFWADGNVEFIEVKGRDLPMGKLKRKQVEALYPITIEVK